MHCAKQLPSAAPAAAPQPAPPSALTAKSRLHETQAHQAQEFPQQEDIFTRDW